MSESDDAESRNPTFDYVTLRLLMGVMAFAIPIVVIYLAHPIVLESISASYHTDAQDHFVGMLFIVAAFLIAYRGRSPAQGLWSKVGAVAAVLVAICPSSTATMPDLPSGPVHYIAAAILFLILAYFCFVFWKKTHASENPFKKRRSPVYAACGIIMLTCIVAIAAANWFFGDTAKALRITFWGEWIALWAFGVAWIVAGKSLPFLSEPSERPKLLADVKAILQKRPAG